MTPLDLITAISASYKHADFVYQNGGCFQFHKILKTAFPDAIPYTSHDHVISLIDGTFYDITGEVDPAGYFDMRTEPNMMACAEALSFDWGKHAHAFE